MLKKANQHAEWGDGALFAGVIDASGAFFFYVCGASTGGLLLTVCAIAFFGAARHHYRKFSQYIHEAEL